MRIWVADQTNHNEKKFTLSIGSLNKIKEKITTKSGKRYRRGMKKCKSIYGPLNLSGVNPIPCLG